jgi:hypothetical protein
MTALTTSRSLGRINDQAALGVVAYVPRWRIGFLVMPPSEFRRRFAGRSAADGAQHFSEVGDKIKTRPARRFE